MPMPDRTAGTSRLSSPIPILKTKKALVKMAAGSTLEVVATDPATPTDFEAFCKATGNLPLERGAHGECYRFLIRRAG